MTNFERIKAMNVEELSEFFVSETCNACVTCPIAEYIEEGKTCIGFIKKWLESEAE